MSPKPKEKKRQKKGKEWMGRAERYPSPKTLSKQIKKTIVETAVKTGSKKAGMGSRILPQVE